MPRFDDKGLSEALVGLGENMANFDLGVYDAISRSQACSGKGILHVDRMVRVILSFCPCAELLPSFLIKVFQAISTKRPEVCGSMRQKAYVGFMAERVTTVLAHLRRIKINDKRFQEAASHLDEASEKQLRALVSLVTIGALGATCETESEEPKKPLKRGLCRESSIVSCDEHGYPNMLRSEVQRDPKNTMDVGFLQTTLNELVAKGIKEAAEAPVEEHEAELEAEAEVDSFEAEDLNTKPKPKPKSAAGPAGKTAKPPAKKPSGHVVKQPTKPSTEKKPTKGWVIVQKVRGPKDKQAGQKYQEYASPNGERYRSLVQATAAGYKEQ